MDTTNDTSVCRKNKHLNQYERGQIQALKNEGLSNYAIAQRLDRAPNTIKNELKRGTVDQIKNNKEVRAYYADTGQLIYERNRENCGKKFKILECEEFIEHVVAESKNNNFSIDSIVGRVKLEGSFPKDQMVCTKTLYNYIDLGLIREILNIDLPFKVKHPTKPRRVREHKKQLGTSIEERPSHINDRKEFGHWEIDLVIGKKTKGESVLMTLTERKSRHEIIRKLDSKSSELVLESLRELLESYGPQSNEIFKTITSDNGSEFALLTTIEEEYDSKVYFAHPYTSCERGTNERHNGLIRRFIPKGKSINDYSVEAIARVANWMNSLPRRILGYWTPDEVFASYVLEIIAA